MPLLLSLMPCSYFTWRKKKKVMQELIQKGNGGRKSLEKEQLFFFLFINHKFQVNKCILLLEFFLIERIEQTWDCVEGVSMIKHFNYHLLRLIHVKLFCMWGESYWLYFWKQSFTGCISNRYYLMCWISRGNVKVRLIQHISSFFSCQFLSV